MYLVYYTRTRTERDEGDIKLFMGGNKTKYVWYGK